jgi:two-component system sensor histidine kinase KdpD
MAELETQLASRDVDVALASDLPVVRCNAIPIARVFVNLVENVANYIPPRSPIRIAAGPSRGTLEVAIEDRGAGISVGKEQAISDKFTRGLSEPAIPGVGLGVAICRAIVTAHGETIRFENGEGGGARLVFTLPSGAPPAVEPEPEQTVAAKM